MYILKPGHRKIEYIIMQKEKIQNKLLKLSIDCEHEARLYLFKVYIQLINFV